VFLLTNLAFALFIVLGYGFNVQMPRIGTVQPDRQSALVLGYGLLFAIVVALDHLQVLNDIPWVRDMHDARGLRWLEELTLALVAIDLWLLQRVGLVHEGIVGLAALILFSSLLSLYQLRYPYALDDLQMFPEATAGNGGQVPGDEALPPEREAETLLPDADTPPEEHPAPAEADHAGENGTQEQ
jgi:hypothetical protein